MKTKQLLDLLKVKKEFREFDLYIKNSTRTDVPVNKILANEENKTIVFSHEELV